MKWSKTEDKRLIDSVAAIMGREGVDWGAVANRMTDRTPKSCESRFWRLGLAQESGQGEAFTIWEDVEILRLKKKNTSYKKMVDFLPGRSEEAIRSRAYALLQGRYNAWIDDERLSAFDIETSNLKANFGWMISWAMECDGKIIGDRILRSEFLDGTLDLRIMKSFLDALKNTDVLIDYYGTNFDLPFLRTRAEILGLDFPAYGQKKHHDLYFSVRSKFQLSNNRLGTACEALGLAQKTHEPAWVWNAARIGNQEAIDKLYKYNINDVAITRQLFDRIRKYVKLTRKSI